MKNTVMRSFALLMAVLIVALSFSACGGELASLDYEANSSYDSATHEMTEESYDGIEDVITDADDSVNTGDQRKIIETIDLTVQTKSFDELLQSMNEQIAALGGYIEGSNISGREMDSYDNRYAEMKIRIPADKGDEFSGFISENSVVTNRSVSTEDVTLTYVDMESRVSALETQKESLERLLAEAQSIEDIIAIQSELTNVIYEIESYKSQLRTYDNLIDYCTINIYIYEVERTVVVEEQNVWQEIGTNLENNFASMWDGVVEAFIIIVSALPFLIPLVVIAAIVVVIVVVCMKVSKSKASSKKDLEVKYPYNPNEQQDNKQQDLDKE